MPGPLEASVIAGLAQVLTLNAETIVMTTPGLSPDTPSRTFRLTAALKVTTGLGATGLIVRVRRGTLVTGTLVGEAASITAAASTTYETPYEVEDAPGEVAGQQYVVTVQQVGATGNGSLVSGEAIVLVY